MTHKSIHIYKWQFDLLRSEYDNLSGIINRILSGAKPRVPETIVDKSDKTLKKVSLNLDDDMVEPFSGCNFSDAVRYLISIWANQHGK